MAVINGVINFMGLIFPFILLPFPNYRNNFINNLVSSIFILSMFAIMLYTVISFSKKSKLFYSNIYRLVSYLDSIENISANYNTFNGALSKDNYIGKEWIEYDKSLIKHKNMDLSYSIFSTCDANYFFDSDIIKSKINVEQFNATPGYFTGLGILGTFVGLTIGLSSINIGAGSDTAALTVGIKGLLAGMGTAFSTSLWGLIFALSLSYYIKKHLNKMQSVIVEFCNKLNNKFVRNDPDTILYDMLVETRLQTEQLRHFNNDLAINIGDALNERITENFKPTFDKLASAIEELSNSGSSTIASSITESVGKELNECKNAFSEIPAIVSSLKDNTLSMQSEFDKCIKNATAYMTSIFEKNTAQQKINQDDAGKRFKETVESVQTTLAMIATKMDDTQRISQERINSTFSTISDNLKGLAQLLSEQSKQHSDSIVTISDGFTEKFKAMSEQLSEMYMSNGSTMSESIEQIKALLEAYKKAMRSAESAATTFASASVPVTNSIYSLQLNLDKLDNTQKKLIEASTDIALKNKECNIATTQSINNLNHLFEATQNALSSYSTDMKNLSKDLNAIFDEIHKGLIDYQTTTDKVLTSQLQNFDSKIANAMGLISSGVDELNDSVESFEDCLKRMNK